MKDLRNKIMDIRIPEKVDEVLAALEAAGFQAYIVGGCVRDALLGRQPGDYDVCTSARPEQIKCCFEGLRTVDTGIRHGTVTVICGGEPVEVTTYRVDGMYSDGRRPDSVEFTADIEADLARRDFTVNAMACSRDGRFVDPYGGREDLRDGLLRCVGVPEERFREDALRIMRAMRFSAVLGFSMEDSTRRAVTANAVSVRKVSAERICSDFSGLILGSQAGRVLFACRDALKAATGLDLANAGIIGRVDRLPLELPPRLAFLLPEVTESELTDFRYDKDTIRSTMAVSRALREELPRDRAGMKMLLREYGAYAVESALAIHGAMGAETEMQMKTLKEILEAGECYTAAQLAVNGSDLIEAGFARGPAIGEMLERLLDEVIEGREENTREGLMVRALKDRQA